MVINTLRSLKQKSRFKVKREYPPSEWSQINKLKERLYYMSNHHKNLIQSAKVVWAPFRETIILFASVIYLIQNPLGIREKLSSAHI